MKHFLFILSLCFLGSLNAQTSALKGGVSEAFTKGTIVGAKITLQNPDGKKILKRTDVNGQFVFDNLVPGKYSATVTMLLFDTLTVDLDLSEGENNYDFKLGGGQELEEVQVIGNLAIDRKTPVAVTRISTEQLAEELGL